MDPLAVGVLVGAAVFLVAVPLLMRRARRKAAAAYVRAVSEHPELTGAPPDSQRSPTVLNSTNPNMWEALRRPVNPR